MAVRDAGERRPAHGCAARELAPGDARAASASGSRRRRGEVRGVVVAPHEGELSWEVLRVDIGAADREHALELVRPGDPIVLDGPPEALPNGRVALGCARRPDRDLRRPRGAATALPPTRPSGTSRSSSRCRRRTTTAARASTAQRLSPDVAIVIEVTYAGDAPGYRAVGRRRQARRRADGVPGPGRQPDRRRRAARDRREGRHHGGDRDRAGRRHTDADDVFIAGDGIAAGIVCVPLRYMHTAGEIVQLSDVDDASRLIEAYARSLDGRDVVPALSRLRRRAAGGRYAETMTRSVIVSTVRTPFGRLGGGLAGHPATELGSIAIRAGLERAGIDPTEVGYVVMGQVLQAGVGQAPARQAAVGAGHPEGGARRHDQQGLRLLDQGDRAGRSDDPRRPARRRRDRRHGVDVERAVPPPEGALRLPARQRRGDRSHGVRRAHVDVRRRPHGRPGLARGARARDLARVAGRLGGAIAVARRGGAGCRDPRRGDRRRRRSRSRRGDPPRHHRREARDA